LQNNANSTSGDINQYIEIDGKRYSHIVDPRTGLGSPNRISATVATMAATITDPLATALTLLPPDRAEEIMEAFGFAAARIEYLDENGKPTILTTTNWPANPDNPPIMTKIENAEALDAPRQNVP
jgi:thiamine biosynthesis lipoprotein